MSLCNLSTNPLDNQAPSSQCSSSLSLSCNARCTSCPETPQRQAQANSAIFFLLQFSNTWGTPCRCTSLCNLSTNPLDNQALLSQCSSSLSLSCSARCTSRPPC